MTALVFVRKGGISQDMEHVDLDKIGSERTETCGGLQHLFA